MTALLEFKQKLKGLYAQYEIYLLPLLKFILAAVYFTWINTNMGYMKALDSMFVVLILALICCILPSGMMIFTGLSEMTLDRVLAGLRAQQIRIPYKAILTPTNQHWTPEECFIEIKKEHEQMHGINQE